MKQVHQLPRLPIRPKNAHKGHFGRILIIAGSRGMSGAACLAAKASLRCGAGLVTLAVPDSSQAVVAGKLTCVMTKGFPETLQGSFHEKAVDSLAEFATQMDVVALGPGLSQHPSTQKMVRDLLTRLACPVVVDADALNALAGALEVLQQRNAVTILTPHPGEFSRLTEVASDITAQNVSQSASDFAKQHKCIVVLKYAPTVVSDGDCFFINTSGNPGMATAGSGDVLTGMIAALTAQKIPPFAAAQLAVFLHGAAGDLACLDKGEWGMIAVDILDKIPYAVRNFIEGRLK